MKTVLTIAGRACNGGAGMYTRTAHRRALTGQAHTGAAGNQAKNHGWTPAGEEGRAL